LTYTVSCISRSPG